MSDLKQILEDRLAGLKQTEPKNINENSLKNITKYLGLNAEQSKLAGQILQSLPRTKLIWLHLCECTGCTESFLRSFEPSFDELIFDFFSLEYHETLMAANGDAAELCIKEAMKGEFMLIVEGGVAAIDTFYYTIGSEGQSGYELLQSLASRASVIFAVGTCSSYGGIQAAVPNPTKTCGISEVLSQKVVQIPGCPPSDVNIIANLLYFVIFGKTPELDEQNRPKWAYGKCLHDMCERKAKFEGGVFANSFGDDLSANGACLFKLGCKGPYTYNNCPKVKFNSKTSWSVAAGHGCMACSEADFWDDFGLYERPMINAYAYRVANELKGGLIYENKKLSDLKEDEIALSLGGESGVYVRENGSLKGILSLEFESNLGLILANLSKNKLGLSLVENYKREFSKNYDLIQAKFDENPKPSKDIFEFLRLIYILANGEFDGDMADFIKMASEYKFDKISPFDFKLSLSENLNQNPAKLDLSKAYRMPLIYLCGGLDARALIYSALQGFLKAFKAVLNTQDKKIILSLDESLNLEYLHQSLARALSEAK